MVYRALANIVSTSPLPKLTMAAELHGPVSMHNGHVVLANSNTGRNTSTTSVSSNANDAVCDSGPDVGTPVKQPNVGSCEGRLTPPEDDRFLPPKRTNLHKGARISLSGSTKGENIFPSARTKYVCCSKVSRDIYMLIMYKAYRRHRRIRT